MPTYIGSVANDRPRLKLVATQTSQEIANNRSRVNLKLYVVSPYNIQMGANSRSGKLQGVSFTTNQAFRGTNVEVLIRETNIWVDHNSNGKKALSLSASFNIGVNWGGVGKINTISVTGSMPLTDIPRASDLTAFSMGSSLKIGTANTINLNLNKKTSAYRHDIQLRIGSTTIATWSGQNTPTSLALTGSEIDTLLSKIPNATSATVTLRVQTKSGNTNIGSVVTRTATARVSSSVLPTINNTFDVSINGNGPDQTLNEYIQNVSRADVRFTSQARGGAKVSRRTVTVNGTVFNAYDITSQLLTQAGTNTIKVEITDTRGRKASETQTIQVRPYTNPRIETLTAERANSSGQIDDDGTHALVKYKMSISDINNKNAKSYKLRYRQKDIGAWQTITLPNDEYSYNATRIIGPLDIDYAFDIQLIIEDSLKQIDLQTTVQSTFSLINFASHKKGMAFGGTYDYSMGGILQTYGESYINGVRNDEVGTVLPNGNGTVSYFRALSQGIYYVRAGIFDDQPAPNGYLTILKRGNSSVLKFEGVNASGVAEIYQATFGTGTSGSLMVEWLPLIPDDFVVEQGPDYTKWNSGKLECWVSVPYRESVVYEQALGVYTRSQIYTWNFPVEFIVFPALMSSSTDFSNSNWVSAGVYGKNSATYRYLSFSSPRTSSGRAFGMYAIGRWK